MNIKGRAVGILHKIWFSGQKGIGCGVQILLIALFLGYSFLREKPLAAAHGAVVDG